MSKAPLRPPFALAVLAYLQQSLPAEHVLEVSQRSSDWEGDTERGFYEVFSAEVSWLHRDTGQVHSTSFSGAEMGALWDFVMSYEPR